MEDEDNGKGRMVVTMFGIPGVPSFTPEVGMVLEAEQADGTVAQVVVVEVRAGESQEQER